MSEITQHSIDTARDIAKSKGLIVVAKVASDPASVQHGVTCDKAAHKPSGGYLHDVKDDSPYDVDGVSYCGRCHMSLP